MPLIITRPVQEAQAWAEHFKQQGIATVVFPLIDIAALSSAAQAARVQQTWEAIHAYQACMFVSRPAVEHFFATRPSEVEVALADLPRCLATGPGTAQALASCGVPMNKIDMPPPDAPQFDSAALWSVVNPRNHGRTWQNARVLVVAGQNPAGKSPGLARYWQEAGAQVDVLAVYERRVPASLVTEEAREFIAQAQSPPWVWLFNSSLSVQHLCARNNVGVGWPKAKALATHERIAQVARAAGFGQVVTVRPVLKDILQGLENSQGLNRLGQ